MFVNRRHRKYRK